MNSEIDILVKEKFFLYHESFICFVLIYLHNTQMSSFH